MSERPKLKPHIWNEPSGICIFCGENREQVTPENRLMHPWWCWDNTYGDPYDRDPEPSPQLHERNE